MPPRTPRPSAARLKDKDLEGWQRQRLQAAQLRLAGGLSLPQIAEEVGMSARTIGSWFAALRKGSVEGLLARKPKGKGPASWLDEATATQAKAGLDKGQWRRAQDARRWLEKKLGRKLSLVSACKYLGKCEARLTACRESGVPFMPEAKLRSLRRRQMRFGLQPVTRRVWTRRGVEVVVPAPPATSGATPRGCTGLLQVRML